VGSGPWPGLRHACYRGSRLASAAAAATGSLHRRLGTRQQAVDTFCTLTEFARSVFVRAGLPEAKLCVSPNFVPDPGNRPRPPSASPTLLYAGRLSPEKGLRVLLEAWSQTDLSPLELLIVGTGPLAAELQRAAPTGVRFEGSLRAAEVQERMLNARALLLPSIWYEGQPMVVLEALAAGLPVLASDLGGLPESTGLGARWLVPAGDGPELGRRLARLRDNALVDAASRQARERYLERHRPEIALARLEAVYRRIQRVQ
jgi:glycosyltransferase involved in cell wall biosynthesis